LCAILDEEANANVQEAVSYFRQLVTGLTLEFGFSPGPFFRRFVAEGMSIGQGFVRLHGL